MLVPPVILVQVVPGNFKISPPSAACKTVIRVPSTCGVWLSLTINILQTLFGFHSVVTNLLIAENCSVKKIMT